MLKPSLIYFTTRVINSFLLIFAAGFMINRELADNFSKFRTHNGPAVSNICYVECAAIKETDDRT